MRTPIALVQEDSTVPSRLAAPPLGQAFLEECEALDALVAGCASGDFARVTDFYGWTVRDEIMHLMFLDEVTLRSICDEEAFLAQKAEIRRYQAEVGEISDYMRKRYADLDDVALTGAWRAGYRALHARFAASDPKARMQWFGPDMSLRSAESARQMEVWAHGQDLYDLFGVVRRNSARLRNICDLGARTFGWSFQNRGLSAPQPPPRVALVSPEGETWVWNDAPGRDEVAGSAEDFALVVTQRRHVDDTGLKLSGEAAQRWMEIAQCFAGAPSDGPRPGERGLRNALTE
jgi:uncharacterized protein (TIGR03084 family)